MRAVRHCTPEFPAGVTPAQAIAFALSICGLPVGQNSKTVGFLLLALEQCGFRIVSISECGDNVTSLSLEREKRR